MNPSASSTDGHTPPEAGVRDAWDKRQFWRRNLPHINTERRPLFVTFCTRGRFELSPPARSLVLRHCLHDHTRKLHMHALVVMPDHVHLLFTPLSDDRGVGYGLSEIMHAIRGASAHSVNKLTGRKGALWQDDYFDRIMRDSDDLFEKALYIRNNPVRKGLAPSAEEYPWSWPERTPDGARPPPAGCH